MQILRRLFPVLIILAAGLLLASCQGEKGSSLADQPLFGDGVDDPTEVIARVGDYEITRRDMEMHYDELVPRMQTTYDGDGGRQLLLKKMVDEVLLSQGAISMGLDKHPDVSRSLVTGRRLTLVEAMRNIGITDGHDPSDEEIQAFFNDNRPAFMQQPMSLARHIECLTLERAQQAYQLLKDDHSPHQFMKVAGDYSVNKKTLQNHAELGWFNPTGIIPDVMGGKELIGKIMNLPKGLHPPVQVADRWHVVEILEQKPGRAMTFNEARDAARNMMLPAYYDNMVKDFLLDSRKTTKVALLGEFTPGGGVDPETLMQRAALAADPGAKIDYYRLIYTDFPESDRADDALFMSAMVCIDHWVDRRMAQRYLDRLLDEYPESDLHDDASFMRENLYNPQGMQPQSIEELRSR